MLEKSVALRISNSYFLGQSDYSLSASLPHVTRLLYSSILFSADHYNNAKEMFYLSETDF